VGVGAFVFSHLLALTIGAWPSVLLVAVAMAAVAWSKADALVIQSGDISEEWVRDPGMRPPVRSLRER
jgi:hypothetical protein